MGGQFSVGSEVFYKEDFTAFERWNNAVSIHPCAPPLPDANAAVCLFCRLLPVVRSSDSGRITGMRPPSDSPRSVRSFAVLRAFIETGQEPKLGLDRNFEARLGASLVEYLKIFGFPMPTAAAE